MADLMDGNWGELDRCGGPLDKKAHEVTWFGVFRLFRWFNRVRRGRWTWAMNTQCKYINVRIDTRTGHCTITDRDGNKITPKQLEWQYSKHTPVPPRDKQ